MPWGSWTGFSGFGWGWAAGRDGIPGPGLQASRGAAVRGPVRRASGDPVNDLAGAPAARALAFPGQPERHAPRAADARASTAPRVTEGRLWARPPVRVRPGSGGRAVQRAATRDHCSRARRVPAAPLEAPPVSTVPRARSPVPGRPAVGGSRDLEPSRAASPGTPSRRTTTGPVRTEHRSQPDTHRFRTATFSMPCTDRPEAQTARVSPWIADLETLRLCCAPSFAATPILRRPHPACRHSSIVRGGYCTLDRG